MSDSTGPSLLSIAPEMRNKIYEHVLLSKHRIDLSQLPHRKQPALLSVCRQIRTEAIAIYYNENKFSFKVKEYDAAKAIPAKALSKKYLSGSTKGHFRVQLCETYVGVNIYALSHWLKAYHGDASVPSLRQDMHAEEFEAQTLARRTFGVVRAMRKEPWSEVEEVLGSFYHAIELLQGEGEGEDDDDDAYEEYPGDAL